MYTLVSSYAGILKPGQVYYVSVRSFKVCVRHNSSLTLTLHWRSHALQGKQHFTSIEKVGGRLEL